MSSVASRTVTTGSTTWRTIWNFRRKPVYSSFRNASRMIAPPSGSSKKLSEVCEKWDHDEYEDYKEWGEWVEKEYETYRDAGGDGNSD